MRCSTAGWSFILVYAGDSTETKLRVNQAIDYVSACKVNSSSGSEQPALMIDAK